MISHLYRGWGGGGVLSEPNEANKNWYRNGWQYFANRPLHTCNWSGNVICTQALHFMAWLILCCFKATLNCQECCNEVPHYRKEFGSAERLNQTCIMMLNCTHVNFAQFRNEKLETVLILEGKGWQTTRLAFNLRGYFSLGFPFPKDMKESDGNYRLCNLLFWLP